MEKILPVLLVFSFMSFAQMPHTFKAGETAKAAEVNANLAFLMARIDTLKKETARIDTLERKLAAAQLPIGTVIAALTVMDTSNGIWALADGRTATTEYFQATGKANVPDLRGQFLRGLNAGRSDGSEDPEGSGRAAGGFQADTMKTHNHNNGGFVYLLTYTNGYNAAQLTTVTNYPDVLQKGAIKAFGGEETRPRNTAVYWYVKVKP
jgi:hypothetical protein